MQSQHNWSEKATAIAAVAVRSVSLILRVIRIYFVAFLVGLVFVALFTVVNGTMRFTRATNSACVQLFDSKVNQANEQVDEKTKQMQIWMTKLDFDLEQITEKTESQETETDMSSRVGNLNEKSLYQDVARLR